MTPAEALRAASRGAALPAALSLPAGELTVLAVLRALPGKRLVLRAEQDGRAVLAKCFLDPRRGAAHARREAEGLARLAAAGLHTPALVAATEAGGLPVLLSEFLPAAGTLSQRWPELSHAGRAAWLARAAADLARLHAAGARHADLHLGNLLVDGDTLYWLDGDAVAAGAGEAQALDNLALLLAQLPAPDAALAAAAYAAYAEAAALRPDWPGFGGRLFAARRTRLAEQYDKAQRRCTAVHQTSRPGRWFACRAELKDGDWAAFIAEPDAIFADPAALRLKDGHSATVLKTRLAGRDVVVKRYNIKSLVHGLGLALRPVSRARNAWAMGLILEKLGLATPAPLAVLEKRLGPFKREAYLICAYTEARDCRRVLPEAAEPGALQRAIGECLRALWAAGLSHGDLKASNVLVDGATPVLIDLDSMRLAATPAALAAAAARDRERFLRNWKERPEFQAGFGL